MGFSEMTGDSNIYRKVFLLNGREEELVLGQYVDDSIIWPAHLKLSVG